MHGNLFLWQNRLTTQWRKDDIHPQKYKIVSLFLTIYKINLKYRKDLNVKGKVSYTFKENIRKYFSGLGIVKDFIKKTKSINYMIKGD